LTNQELFEYSRDLNKLLSHANDLLSCPATKYYHLVVSSPWGLECKYAKAIAQEVPEGNKELEGVLRALITTAQELLDVQG